LIINMLKRLAVTLVTLAVAVALLTGVSIVVSLI